APIVIPVVRHMLLCEDARASASDPRKINIFGLMNRIQPTEEHSEFPLRHSFAVYLELSAGRGTGKGQIAVEFDDSSWLCFVGKSHDIEFGHDPLVSHAARFLRAAEVAAARAADGDGIVPGEF